MKFNLAKAAVFAGASLMSATAAAEFYVAGSYGIVDQDDSSNKGNFTSDFTTGTVTGVNPPLTIPAQSPVGWKTEFDRGDQWTLALGWKIDNFRVELEYARSASDVDTHKGVSAAGIDLTDIDAGVLISGNVGDLGVTVGELVANGRGEIETDSFFLNGYYDFENESAFTPFVGVGIGTTTVDVEYAPSGVPVISDDDSGMSYQAIVGADYEITEALDVVLSIQYVTGDDATVSSSLLPAKFDIENESISYRLGLRYTF